MPNADIATLNRAAWTRPDAIVEFKRLEGFIDAGERASLLIAAPRVRGEATLDVGVGAGRTVSLLRLMTDRYRAIDYTPAMVEICRELHPEIDVQIGDARDLSTVAEKSLGFVFFSFSGIDAVEHDDRTRILSEFHRTLRPGGWVLFSTHNLDGPSYRERPWRGYRMPGSRWYRLLRWAARLPINARSYVRRWRNWWRNRQLNRVGDGWAVRVAAPHDFGIVIHYVTLEASLAEVARAGFTAMEIYDSERGRRIERGSDVSDVHAFYVLAQRPV